MFTKTNVTLSTSPPAIWIWLKAIPRHKRLREASLKQSLIEKFLRSRKGKNVSRPDHCMTAFFQQSPWILDKFPACSPAVGKFLSLQQRLRIPLAAFYKDGRGTAFAIFQNASLVAAAHIGLRSSIPETLLPWVPLGLVPLTVDWHFRFDGGMKDAAFPVCTFSSLAKVTT
jgi:hypothetical protein